MHRYRVLVLVMFTAVSYLAGGCTGDRAYDPRCPDYPWAPEPGILTPPDIAAVPETLTVESRSYIVESFLWRDFMPVCPPNGDPMIAHIRVIAIDSLAVPPGSDAVYLWVFKNGEMWGSYFTDERLYYEMPYELVRIARCGPKWETGILVDVVVKVMIGDACYFLKEEDVRIVRTD